MMLEVRLDNVEGRWYVYGYDPDKCQCVSVGSSNPPNGGRYFARGVTAGAVAYVGMPYKNYDSAARAVRKLQSGGMMA